MSRNKFVVISGEYPEFILKLESMGIKTISTYKHSLISEKVSYHADMQVLKTKLRTYVLKGEGHIKKTLLELGEAVTETAKPSEQYPQDVLCNGKIVGGILFCNKNTIDESIYNVCKNDGYKIINVSQGYTGCSICNVDDNSIITSDDTIAEKARLNGFDVLHICSGFIKLSGFDYGFIGGCSGKLSDGRIFFTGCLRNHPDGEKIRSFIESKDIQIIELTNGPLIDIGGIVEI